MSNRITIKQLPKFDKDEFAFYWDVYSKKGRKKLCDEVKKLVRRSPEYKDYIHYLRTYVDMVKCAVYEQVRSDIGGAKITIEIHHDPLNLDDIVHICLSKQLSNDEFENEFTLAEEVARLHYKNQVGLIPLCKSIHELITYRPDLCRLPLQLVYGNYNTFLREYDEYITDEVNEELHDLRGRLKERFDYSIESISKVCTDMEPNFVVLKVDGQSVPTLIPTSVMEDINHVA